MGIGTEGEKKSLDNSVYEGIRLLIVSFPEKSYITRFSISNKSANLFRN